MTRRIYRNPPVAEAICEVRFAPQTPWDATVGTRIWESLRGEYDGTPVAQPMMQISFGPAGPTQTLVESRTNFPNADGTRTLAVGEHVITVHFRKHYPGWDEFGGAIERVCTSAYGILPDAAVARVGVRFVNKIEIPGGMEELNKALQVAPRTEGFATGKRTSFLERHEFLVEDPTVVLIRTLATIVADKADHVAALLDVDAIYQAANGVFLQRGDVSLVIEKLRQVRTDAFEASISDTLREIFDAA